MKKQKLDGQRVKAALKLGLAYAKKRGFRVPELELSQPQKVECVYRLLVQDKLITPLPVEKETGAQMKHRLVIWLEHQLPQDHPLRA